MADLFRSMNRLAPVCVGALCALPLAVAAASIEFLAPISMSLDKLPAAIAVGDLNDDGHPDVILSHYVEASLTILHGTGSASFSFGGELPVGVGGFRLYVEDLDGDDVPDLAVSHDESNDVSLLRGRGDGTFETPQVIHPGHDPVGLAFADLDGDTVLDIIVALSDEVGGQVTVMRGQGGMQFEVQQNLAVATDCVEVVVHDFDGDGVMDAVTSNPRDGTISFLPGVPGGTFEVGTEIQVGPGSALLALADVDVDGLVDIVVGRTADQMISVLRSRGDGTFEALTSYFSGGRALSSMVVADVDSDGISDIVASHLRSHSVGVLLGRGDGAFSSTLAFTVGTNPVVVGVGDFNGDERVDIVSANEGVDSAAPGVALLLGDGSGQFTAPEQLFAAGDPIGAAVGDFTADGIADAVVGSKDMRGIVILPGGRTPREAAVFVSTDREPSSVLAADLDNDGYVDLLTLNDDDLSVLYADAAGGFSPVVHLSTSASVGAFTVADFDGDGDGDLVTSSAGDPFVLSMLRNDGGRLFTALEALGNAPAATALIATDIDGDGREDVIANESSSQLVLFAGAGEAGLIPAGNLDVQGTVTGLAAGDVDGDGTVDIVGLSPTGRRLTTFLNEGGGSFDSGRSLPIGFALGLALRDLDSDNLPDAIVPDLLTGEVTFLQNAGDGLWLAPKPIAAGDRPAAAAAGDFNDDGRYDVIATGVSVVRFVNETAIENHVVRGDGNQDGLVAAADLVALVKELFDGDGRQVEAVMRGTFVGGYGADADGDGVVLKADLRTLLRRIHSDSGA